MAQRRKKPVAVAAPVRSGRAMRPELVIITGVSGSGKGTVLKALEDLGYYAVDNLPMALLETFAGLVKAEGIRLEIIFHFVPQSDRPQAFFHDLIHPDIHAHHARPKCHVVVNGLRKWIRFLENHAYPLP